MYSHQDGNKFGVKTKKKEEKQLGSNSGIKLMVSLNYEFQYVHPLNCKKTVAFLCA